MEKRKALKEKWKHRLLTCFLVPAAFGSFGLGIYLAEITGALMWLPVLGFFGPLFFGIAGLLIEGALLRSFRCPRCRQSIPEHMTDDELRVSYICTGCAVQWETGVSMAHHRSELNMM